MNFKMSNLFEFKMKNKEKFSQLEQKHKNSFHKKKNFSIFSYLKKNITMKKKYICNNFRLELCVT
jgi:hypothetical protein